MSRFPAPPPLFHKVEEKLKVPANTGIEGFILLFRKILTTPRVQRIEVNLHGEVHVERLVAAEDPEKDIGPMEIDFGPLQLPAIVQRAEAVAISQPLGMPNERIIPHLLSAVQVDHLYPILFVVQDRIKFQKWLEATVGCLFGGGCFGLGLEEDPELPEDALLLLAGPEPSSVPLNATHKFRAALPFQGKPHQEFEMEFLDANPS